jgi:hypothetical protein
MAATGHRQMAEDYCSSALAASAGSAMKRVMRVPILMISLSLAAQPLVAGPLSSADREALLDSLDKLKGAAEGKRDTRIRAALSAFRSASGSDEAAMELYLNCVERVNFEDQNKKAADFREWKRKQGDNLSNPAMKTALRYQLSWLVVALESISKDANRKEIAADAQQIVGSRFSNPDKLRGQVKLLSQSVMSTVFAQAYDVNHFNVTQFPLAPLPVGTVYEKLVLPALRKPATVASLQAAWLNRIQQETIMVEGFNGGRGSSVGRGGTPVTSTVSSEYLDFIEDTKPTLQWEMEIDLFQNGDESGAAVRMLAHLEKNIAHPSAKKWGQELKKLLGSPDEPPTGNENLVAPDNDLPPAS